MLSKYLFNEYMKIFLIQDFVPCLEEISNYASLWKCTRHPRRLSWKEVSHTRTHHTLGKLRVLLLQPQAYFWVWTHGLTKKKSWLFWGRVFPSVPLPCRKSGSNFHLASQSWHPFPSSPTPETRNLSQSSAASDPGPDLPLSHRGGRFVQPACTVYQHTPFEVNGSKYMQFCCSVAQLCLTLQPHGLKHTRLPCPSPTPRVYANSYPSNR